MTTSPTAHVITANDLKDGLVVFQMADDNWTQSVGLAEIIASDTELEVGLSRAQKAEDDQLIVGPYAIVVDASGDLPYPTKYRERIRAYGPSVHPAFAHDIPEQNQNVHHTGSEGGR